MNTQITNTLNNLIDQPELVFALMILGLIILGVSGLLVYLKFWGKDEEVEETVYIKHVDEKTIQLIFVEEKVKEVK